MQLKTQQSEVTMSSSYIKSKINIKIACLQGNQALNVCSNNMCANFPFVCSNKLCQCRTYHSDCLKTDIQGLLSNIKQNSKIFKPLQKKINEAVEKSIEKIESQKQNILQSLQKIIKNTKISQTQTKLLIDLEQGNLKQITGAMIWEIQANIFKDSQVSRVIERIFDKINNQQEKLNRKIVKFGQQIKQALSFINNGQLFNQSKLVKFQQQRKQIQDFFFKKINSSVLLYRASENQFLIDKFYEKCSNIIQTITICQTQYDKIVGGYTDLPWYRSVKSQQICDEKNSSFLFSLTNKDKFVLQNKKYAINRSNSYGPAFGNGWDLFIRDKANINNYSGGRINSSYVNEKYDTENKQNKFLGTKAGNINCKLKQWQVWKIQFEE